MQSSLLDFSIVAHSLCAEGSRHKLGMSLSQRLVTSRMDPGHIKVLLTEQIILDAENTVLFSVHAGSPKLDSATATASQPASKQALRANQQTNKHGTIMPGSYAGRNYQDQPR